MVFSPSSIKGVTILILRLILPLYTFNTCGNAYLPQVIHCRGLTARILAPGCPLWGAYCGVPTVDYLLQGAHYDVLTQALIAGILTARVHCEVLTTGVLLQGAYYRAFSAGLLITRCLLRSVHCRGTYSRMFTTGCLLQNVHCRDAYSRDAGCRVLIIGHL